MKKDDLEILVKAITMAMEEFGVSSVHQFKPSDANYKGVLFDCSKDTLDRIIKASKGVSVSLKPEIAAEVAEQCGLQSVRNGLGYDVSLPNGMTWHELKAWQKANMELNKGAHI